MWFAVLGLVAVAPLAVPGNTPEASAGTDNYYIQPIYYVPQGADRSDRAYVIDEAMKAIQAQWANFGLTFQLAPVQTVYPRYRCSDFFQGSDTLGMMDDDINAFNRKNIIFMVSPECQELRGGGGVMTANLAICFNIDGMEANLRGGPYGAGGGDVGCIGHEVGHSFTLPHENCNGQEPNNASGLRSQGLPDYATASVMCNGGTPLGIYEDPSVSWIRDRMLNGRHGPEWPRGCEFIFECSGGSKLPRLADPNNPIANEAQLIRNGNGDCLDIPSGSRDAFVVIQTWDCVEDENDYFRANQLFRVIPARDNVQRRYSGGWGLNFTNDGYLLRSVRSGMCVDTPFGSQNPGTELIQHPCNDYAYNKVFYVQGNTIRVKHSGLCLASTGTANGSKVVQQQCDGSPGQTWTLTENPNRGPVCTYAMSNSSAERIYLSEVISGQSSDYAFIEPGQGYVFTLSPSFAPPQSKIAVHLGGYEQGQPVAEYNGPCGSSYEYEDPDPGPVCTYAMSNSSAERIYLSEIISGQSSDYAFIEPGQGYVFTLSPSFVPGESKIAVHLGGYEQGQPVAEYNGPCGSSYEYEDPDPGPSSVSGGVTDADGVAVSGVLVDLFTANESGQRLEYLKTASTDSGGGYEFEVDAGCHSVTFIAPDGRSFINGSQWSSVAMCVDAGESFTGADAVLRVSDRTGGNIGDSVTDTRGDGVDGVSIDLFTASADGSRGTWLMSTVTSSGGLYEFDTPPGCFVVTFIAPDGNSFTNGSQWYNRGVCVDAGEVNTGIDAVLAAAGEVGVLSGSVTKGDSGYGPLPVDVFTVNADGSRGVYVGSTAAQPSGAWSYEVNPGCYAVTFVAIDDESFINGLGWYTTSACVDPGETVTDIDAQLTP